MIVLSKEEKMDPLIILRIAVTLVMSAIIGIFTNYIAVKMLFRPYKAKYIGKFHVPFTPGIMPRRQGALAKALGRMISESLVRTEDLKNALLSDEISHTIAKGILSFPSVRASGEALFAEQYGEKRDAVLDLHQISVPTELSSDAEQSTGCQVQSCQLTFTGLCGNCHP